MQRNDMTGESKLRGLLGLASRARNLLVGTELCCDGVRSGKAHLVLVSFGASANTKKRIFNCCTYYECELAEIPVSTEALGKCIGKKRAVSCVAVTDVHFTKGMKKILSNTVFNESKTDKRSSEV